MARPNGPTPSPSRAPTASDPDSTATTSNTTTPPSSSGSVPDATPPAIPIDGAGSEPDQTRFRYQSKASRAERNAGLEGFEERRGGGLQGTHDQPMLTGSGNERNPMASNHHPTVKPIALMRWLVRLVTPPGGLICDPFTGSGTTGCAAVLEGFDFLGLEREAEYAEIARARIAYWADPKTHEIRLAEARRLEERAEAEEAGEAFQMDLFG